MSYIKNTWANGDKVTAEKLNNIENGIENVTNKTKVVEKEFKEFENVMLPAGFSLTVDNVQNLKINSKIYYAEESNGREYRFMYTDTAQFAVEYYENGEFSEYVTGETGIDFEESVYIYEDSADRIGEGDHPAGTGLLGYYVDKQLTAQEVYDNTKFKDEVIYNGPALVNGHYVPLPELKDGLYELRFGSVNFSNYTAIFRISNGMSRGITNIWFTNYEGNIVNGGFIVGIIDNDGQEILGVQFYDTDLDETVSPEADAIMTLTQIL